MRPAAGGAKATLADQAADTLRARVVSGELPVGGRLPAERELIEQLGVSRTVLREALSRLEALGMLEARGTRGRYVAAGGLSERSRPIVSAWLRQHAEEILEVDEIRAMIEAHVVRSMSEWEALDAARRAGPILAAQDEAIGEPDPVAAADADADFHCLLCSYTRNRTLLVLAEELVETSRKAALAVYSLADAARLSLEQHREIVARLAGGDVESAARLAQAHMVDSARRHAESE